MSEGDFFIDLLKWIWPGSTGTEHPNVQPRRRTAKEVATFLAFAAVAVAVITTIGWLTTR